MTEPAATPPPQTVPRGTGSADQLTPLKTQHYSVRACAHADPPTESRATTDRADAAAGVVEEHSADDRTGRHAAAADSAAGVRGRPISSPL